MRVVGRPVLEQYRAHHADAARPLSAWLKTAENASWTNLIEVRKSYPHADFVKPFTVFNIKGNKYRLITKINYKQQLISVETCMTHAEYDKGNWK